MQKYVSDYLDTVCAAIRRKSLHPMVRVELADHLTERCEELAKEGMEPEAAAREAVLRMGDPYALGRKITEANRSRVNLLTIWGGAALALLTLGTSILWGGGQLASFIDPASIIGVLGLSAACGVLGCGRKPAPAAFLKGAKTGALYGGILITVMGIIIMLSNIDDPSALGSGAAAALLSSFYGLLINIGVRAVEPRFAAPAPGAIRKLLD